MTDGSLKTLVTTDLPNNVDAGVTSVAISSDGRLVAAGCLDTVRNFSQLLADCVENTFLIEGTYLGRSYRCIVGEPAGTQRWRVQCGIHPRCAWVGERQFG